MRRSAIAGTSCLLVSCGVLVDEDERARVLDYDRDGYVSFEVDCRDTNPEIHPGATERCNGLDDDCDGVIDGPDAEGAAPWFRDADDDGLGDDAAREIRCAAAGWVPSGGDCDDTDAAVGVCP